MTVRTGWADQPLAADAATDAVKRLLAATSTRDNDVSRVIDALGAELAARVLLDEIVFRAELDDLASPAGETASVILDLAHRGNLLRALITVGPKGTEVYGEVARYAPAADELPAPVVRQELSEVAVALFGPAELTSAATRTIQWPGHEVVVPSPERLALPTIFYATVQRIVRALDRRDPVDLTELAVRCGTDKWGALHQYPRHYQRHFGPLRDRRLTILEIGIGGYHDPEQGGASLRMWRHYFPRAVIYGLDIVDKRPLDAPRVVTARGDQSKTEQLEEFARRHGPFDIVIDDGSHVSRDVLISFRALFPHLRPEGLYVIEDLHTSYWPEVFHGNDENLDDPRYTVGFLKTLVDGLHHEELLRPEAREPLPTDTQVTGLHLYHNLVVIEKGRNTEGSPVADLLREERAAQQ
ncbi:hypothetical protein [Micromonospora sp. NPDC048830]|uniref:hypothetical protein n=1 Tax=Micromonospora sp. NPDC048830 TaxID=3364257 RepID=UPI00371CB942